MTTTGSTGGPGGSVGAPPPASPGNGHGTYGDGAGTPFPPTGGNGHGPVDPYAPPPPKPWYRRSSTIAAAVIVVVAAVAVVADLPTHATTSDHVKAMTTEVNAINKYARPCTFAVKQAFTFYEQERNGQLSASDQAKVPGYLRDDQSACSFTDQSIVNLGTLTLPQTPGGKQLSGVVTAVLQWETSDGVAAIDDIQTLVAQPNDTHAAADLRHREQLLASDRAAARKAANLVNQAVGSAGRVPPPALPRLPTNFPPA